MSNRYFGGAHRIPWLLGDIYPSNFSYNSLQFNQDLFALWKRNEFVQLLIDWMPYEAFRRGVQFIDEEGPISAFKYGEPFTFEGYEYEDKNTGEIHSQTPFEQYCEWNNIQNEWVKAVSISRLFAEGCLLVFLDDIDELYPNPKNSNEISWPANPDPQGYFAMRAYLPLNASTGSGFEVEESDADGNVTIWKVQRYTKHMKSAKTFLIDAGRCLHIQWKSKTTQWEANSRCEGMARVAQLENAVFEKLSKRAHDIAGGILQINGVSSKAEQETLDNDLGNDLTSVDRIYLQEGREVDYKTPDLKAAGEFLSIFEMFSRKLCRHMRISQLILDGEHTGAGLGGNNNVELMNSYSEIYQIQEHYKTALEHVFYKLGKKNTTFIYNEILPEEMTIMEEMIDEQAGTRQETSRQTKQKPKPDEKREPSD